MSDPEAVKRAMESDDCAILRKQLADQDRAYIHHMNAVDTELAKAKAENERLKLDNERLMLTRFEMYAPNGIEGTSAGVGWKFSGLDNGNIECTPLPWAPEFTESMKRVKAAVARQAAMTEADRHAAIDQIVDDVKDADD